MVGLPKRSDNSKIRPKTCLGKFLNPSMHFPLSLFETAIETEARFRKLAIYLAFPVNVVGAITTGYKTLNSASYDDVA